MRTRPATAALMVALMACKTQPAPPAPAPSASTVPSATGSDVRDPGINWSLDPEARRTDGCPVVGDNVESLLHDLGCRVTAPSPSQPLDGALDVKLTPWVPRVRPGERVELSLAMTSRLDVPVLLDFDYYLHDPLPFDPNGAEREPDIQTVEAVRSAGADPALDLVTELRGGLADFAMDASDPPVQVQRIKLPAHATTKTTLSWSAPQDAKGSYVLRVHTRLLSQRTVAVSRRPDECERARRRDPSTLGPPSSQRPS